MLTRCHTSLIICSLLFAVTESRAAAQDTPAPPADITAPATPAPGAVAFDAERPALGSWSGYASTPAGTQTFIFMTITAADDAPGGYAVTAVCPDAMVLNSPAKDITIDGPAIALTIPGPGDDIRLEGTINGAAHNHQTFTGTAHMIAARAADPDHPPATITLQRTYAAATLPTARAYTGAINVNGMELAMTFVFAETPNHTTTGHLDVPMQQITGLPLTDVRRTAGNITGDVPVPGGASFDFTFNEDDTQLTGSFHQSGMTMPGSFTLDPDYVPASLARPQHPQPPFPYTARDITIDHPDDFTIAGTLTLPDSAAFGAGPYPLAVLISGSGQQDRDETLLGHKPFLVIAHALTTSGIATFRYDDRGVGASGGLDTVATATTRDWADDAALIYRHLLTLDEIDPARIGLIGHSEGAVIAPLVADQLRDTSRPVAFIVLLAGPGVVGSELLAKQTELGWISAGIDPAIAAEHAALYHQAIDAIIAGADEDDIHQRLMVIGDKQAEAGIAHPDREMRAQAIRPQAAMLVSPWMKWFLAYDPQPALRRLDCPILAMIGEKDVQVWHEQNMTPMEQIFKETAAPATIKRYPELNHLFQPANTGSPMEYATIETTFHEQPLNDLTTWIKSITSP